MFQFQSDQRRGKSIAPMLSDLPGAERRSHRDDDDDDDDDAFSRLCPPSCSCSWVDPATVPGSSTGMRNLDRRMTSSKTNATAAAQPINQLINQLSGLPDGLFGETREGRAQRTPEAAHRVHGQRQGVQLHGIHFLRLLGLAAENMRSDRRSSALGMILCNQGRDGVRRPAGDGVVRLAGHKNQVQYRTSGERGERGDMPTLSPLASTIQRMSYCPSPAKTWKLSALPQGNKPRFSGLRYEGPGGWNAAHRVERLTWQDLLGESSQKVSPPRCPSLHKFGWAVPRPKLCSR
jgi:hypothetical protein